jgi:hypothetical protein
MTAVGGKHKRRHLTAGEHRERAQRYRMQAIQNLDAKIREELMLSAIKHEAIAEELARLESDEN